MPYNAPKVAKRHTDIYPKLKPAALIHLPSAKQSETQAQQATTTPGRPQYESAKERTFRRQPR